MDESNQRKVRFEDEIILDSDESSQQSPQSDSPIIISSESDEIISIASDSTYSPSTPIELLPLDLSPSSYMSSENSHYSLPSRSPTPDQTPSEQQLSQEDFCSGLGIKRKRGNDLEEPNPKKLKLN